MYREYFGRGAGPLTRALMPSIAAALRRWDRRASARVHDFVAISHYVADRIRRCYGRAAEVIYPPVDVQRVRLADDDPEDFYLVVSALVPYKRIDLAVEAAKALGRRLLVVGTGPEQARLQARAGPTVEFLGWRDDAEVADLYRRCRALLFPGREDFGIVPLEAMAAGRPVIAFAGGGALETVAPLGGEEPPTGVFFRQQTAGALAMAVRRFEDEAHRFDPKALRARAVVFDRPRFKERMKSYLDARLAGKEAKGDSPSGR
jgi:glycosyltransferase involved in cell wall biosynthesis